MKKNIWVALLLFIQLGVNAQTPQEKLNEIFRKKTEKVLVAAHRGDWRNSPENSVQSLKNCIDRDIDVAEFDLAKTKDGKLIIMHDKTINRTTNGKGKPQDFTLEEIRKFYLLSGTGHPTRHIIPTLEEMLVTAKDKIIIDIDKGYEYFDEVILELKKQKMLEQTIYNIYGLPYDSLLIKHQNIPEELTLQLIINPKNPEAEKIIDTYKNRKRTIIQIIFDNDTSPLLSKVPEFKKRHPIWFNSLWPEHCGGHDDDIAVEENKPDETWGWLVAKGANIIQSDRPIELKQYLKKINK
ncbi:glycerophosphodiester phosphodiesterase family protein [Pedobacter glucosidilyticus]|uniref:glycerophosphodiester phosphodiesterase family protein n=1 Tax=Pedobacter glucosidilyticus TaxID=1122941 RepID=UPI000405BB44|nr:glycerophosphodiester phosphodiesterase family protein [Pedobacter glucosidilyticus]